MPHWRDLARALPAHRRSTRPSCASGCPRARWATPRSATSTSVPARRLPGLHAHRRRDPRRRVRAQPGAERRDRHRARAPARTLHVLGLLSPGRRAQPRAADRGDGRARRRAPARAVPSRVHAFLDGRDTPPQQRRRLARVAWRRSARGMPGARIASICGRYYAMDRDQRWDRVAQAYELLVDGDAPFTAASARAGARRRLRARRERRVRQADGHRAAPAARPRACATATSWCS